MRDKLEEAVLGMLGVAAAAPHTITQTSTVRQTDDQRLMFMSWQKTSFSRGTSNTKSDTLNNFLRQDAVAKQGITTMWLRSRLSIQCTEMERDITEHGLAP